MSASATPSSGNISTTRNDGVKEGSVGVFVQNTTFWTDWLRTNIGWRGDYYDTTVNSFFNPVNSGSATATIGEPQGRFGDWSLCED